MAVDYRSLIQFCKSFKWRPNMGNFPTTPVHQASHRRKKSISALSHPFCEHSPFAAIDIIILLLVLVALGVLTVPCFELILCEVYELLPEVFEIIRDVICHAPLAYATGFFLTFVATIIAWEIIDHRSRKCGKPDCKGLRKVVEFDIQLETEECVKYLPLVMTDSETRPLDLGKDHKELKAELKKMAPLNGRTVLILHATCGCPRGRMEVWGPKKARRIKKIMHAESKNNYTYR